MDDKKQCVINNINFIISNYYNNRDIETFYNQLCQIDDDIHLYISENLYREYKIEHRCIYYEIIYGGDEEDADIVVNDCIVILERIINIIVQI
jgi:hypothetical protein